MTQTHFLHGLGKSTYLSEEDFSVNAREMFVNGRISQLGSEVRKSVTCPFIFPLLSIAMYIPVCLCLILTTLGPND